MITIHTLTFNPFQENTYILSAPGGECVVIDAGNYSAAEDRQISAFIEEKGLKPVIAINTHGHVDHILGVQYLKDTYGIPFALRREDDFLVETAPQHGQIYGFQVGEVPKVEQDLSAVESIPLGDTGLQIIHTPGHTPGHVCFFEPHTRSLFCGDTVFRESIGRTDLPGGDYSWIMRSILDKIIPLGDDVTLYPGHGPKTTIGHEVLYNPFIVEVLNGDVNYQAPEK